MSEVSTPTKSPLASGLETASLVTSGVTGILGFAYDIWEYNDQKKEQRRLEKKADALQARQDAKDAERYNTELTMTRQGIAEEKKRYKAGMAIEEDDRQYSRGTAAIGHFLSTLAKKPELENRMMSIFTPRRFF
jgi:hypothetical protein